ncbi:MAG: hypothetical protein LAO03_18485 [Acidobacteriia bacterium]|nr:hypothetical protein [Terriglobia bacterium]
MSTAVVIPFAPQPTENRAAMERYRDAYRMAGTAADFGETVRLGGIFLAGVTLVGSLVAFQVSKAEHSAFPVVTVTLLACAVLLVLIAHVWSIVFRALGELLKVATDSAVNSSPLLSNAQRAEAMSLARQVANVTSIQGNAA